MTNAAGKLNIPAASAFDLCPVALLGVHGDKAYNPFNSVAGKALPRAQIKLLAHLHTVNRNFSANAVTTVADLARACGISWNAAKSALSRLIKQGLVVRNDKKKNAFKIEESASRYINSKKYFVIDRCFNTKKFKISGKEKKLSASAVIVLARFKSFYLTKSKEGTFVNYDFKNRKPINVFLSSEQWLSSLLHLPKSTVANAVKELLRAGLLYRNKRLSYLDENGNKRVKVVHERDVTGNTQSAFVVPFEVLAIEQRSTYKPQKAVFENDFVEFDDTVTESEIEEVYKELRAKAQANAEEARKTVFADEKFNVVKAELDEATSAYFGSLGDRDRLARSLAKAARDEAIARYNNRLAELGFTEADLSPQYLCEDCDDTGFELMTGRRCKCRSRVVELIRERKKRK